MVKLRLKIQWAKALFAVFYSCSTYAAQGDLLGMNPLPDLAPQQLAAVRQKLCPATTVKNPDKLVRLFSITYETVDIKLNPVTASGLIAIPYSDTDSYSIVSYQHGTVLRKDDVPSRLNREGLMAAACLTGPGFMLVASDYLGYGANAGFHPYLHAQSEGSVAADMLTAADHLRKSLNLQANGKLFLTGYSQGGQVTMALHRHLESTGSPYEVTASAPLDGVYDLEMWLFDAINTPSALSSVLMSYAIWTRHNTLPILKNIEEAVRQPWAANMGSIFNGQNDWAAVQIALPKTPAELLEPNFLQNIVNDPDHAYRKALREDSVYDWKPAAPIWFMHASGDDVISYKNAEKAANHMTSLGVTNIKLIDLGPYTHQQAVPFAFMAAAKFFEGF